MAQVSAAEQHVAQSAVMIGTWKLRTRIGTAIAVEDAASIPPTDPNSYAFPIPYFFNFLLELLCAKCELCHSPLLS